MVLLQGLFSSGKVGKEGKLGWKTKPLPVILLDDGSSSVPICAFLQVLVTHLNTGSSSQGPAHSSEHINSHIDLKLIFKALMHFHLLISIYTCVLYVCVWMWIHACHGIIGMLNSKIFPSFFLTLFLTFQCICLSEIQHFQEISKTGKSHKTQSTWIVSRSQERELERFRQQRWLCESVTSWTDTTRLFI